MQTFFDVIKEPEIRRNVENILTRVSSKQGYIFPSSIPLLYRYRSLSSYAVEDIVNEKLTLTAIGEFNDLFDGAIHLYGSTEKIHMKAESEWAKLEDLRIAAHMPEGLLTREALVVPLIEHYRQESRQMFEFLYNAGTYACCFSENVDSVLMWSHYADSSQGICMSYDFNQWKESNILFKTIFPVSYSNNPLDLSNLLDDDINKSIKNPVDTAAFCAILNKSFYWAYENEWRLFFMVGAPTKNYLQRFQINIGIKPSAIYLGYHFLKPFFYYDRNNQNELTFKKENIFQLRRLLIYLQKNRIALYVMTPAIGSYSIKPSQIGIEVLSAFLDQHFKDNEPRSFDGYSTILHRLLDCLEKRR